MARSLLRHNGGNRWLFAVRWKPKGKPEWKGNTLAYHSSGALAWFLRIHPEALLELERVTVDMVRNPISV